MKKVDNLRKALADIDAKAARLAYARERILERLEAREVDAAGDFSAASNATPGSGVGEAPDATAVQMTDSSSAVVTEGDGWTKDSVKAAIEGYLATHQCRAAATEPVVTAICNYADDRTPRPIAQIISEFVTAFQDFLESLARDQDVHADLHDIFDVCFHAGYLLDDLLPEGSNGHLESGPRTY